MTDGRPFVFIGSSTEGLEVAKAIQVNLDYICECQIWHQGLFGLSGGTLETLVQSLVRFDFAILVLTPDDLLSSRGDEKKCPRDNVLFELGLFIGSLGRQRTYMVIDRSAGPKLPSDLAGITPATFQRPSSGTMQSAVGAACNAIEESIKQQGRRRAVGCGTAPADKPIAETTVHNEQARHDPPMATTSGSSRIWDHVPQEERALLRQRMPDFVTDALEIASQPHLFGRWRLVVAGTGEHGELTLETELFTNPASADPLRVEVFPIGRYPIKEPQIAIAKEHQGSVDSALVEALKRLCVPDVWASRYRPLKKGRLIHLADSINGFQEPASVFRSDGIRAAAQSAGRWNLNDTPDEGPTLTYRFKSAALSCTISVRPTTQYPLRMPHIRCDPPPASTRWLADGSPNWAAIDRRADTVWAEVLPAPNSLFEVTQLLQTLISD